MQTQHSSFPTTVAVVVRNDAAGMLRLLHSLDRSFRRIGHSWPVLVIDNSSSTVFTEFLSSLPSRFPDLSFQFIFRRANSISDARQQALEYSQTDWVTFLDPDCCVTARWAEYCERWMNVFRHDPNVWAWGGPSIFRGVDPLTRLKRGFGQFLPVYRATSTFKTAKHIPSSQLFLKRKTILGIGGFPKGYDRVGEDMALSLLIRSLGGKLFLVDRPRVFHAQRGTFLGQLKRLQRNGEAHGALAWRHPQHLFSRQFIPLLAISVGSVSALLLPLQLLTFWGASLLGCLLILVVSSTASFRKSFTSLLFGLSAFFVYGASSLIGFVMRARRSDF